MTLTPLPAQPSASPSPLRQFQAVDIYVDPKGQSLAAYQIEFSALGGDAKVIGIEGGQSQAFSVPPFYDPKAMQQERVIIAAFSTNAASHLPKETTRVATIHLQYADGAPPRIELKLHAAGDSKGIRIPAIASFAERKTK
jgi:hypothetical protein